ncbi:GerAB/ArcD/ProY family transporter [Niallia circulans]|uniref:GerAB/ArcD/ProY family transporter n=1 Tax=Niallia circulans TaxID=1397 RepID=UPI001C2677C8|nr:endospore germination permease [Niallia circulans]
MVLKEKISLNQLFHIVIGFNLGSSLIIGIGINAKQDAWIAVLCSSIIGIFIALFYYHFQEILPNKHFSEMLEYILNRPISIFITYIYTLYFFYLAARVIRDFGELVTTFILPNTPIEVCSLSFVIILTYIIYLGVEVLGRVTEVFTPYSILFIILVTILLFGNNDIKLERVTPILATGVKPLLNTIFPYELIRPYGQLFALTFLFSHLPKQQYARHTLVYSVLSSGFWLTIGTFIVTTSLGPYVASRSTFPLVSATRLISIGDFLQRVDAFAIFIIALGVVIKICIFSFAALKGLEYIFKLPYRVLVIPMMCILTICSSLISINFSDHITESITVVPYFLSLPLFFLLPSLFMVLALIKKKKDA